MTSNAKKMGIGKRNITSGRINSRRSEVNYLRKAKELMRVFHEDKMNLQTAQFR
jgi:hypothetical protein